jgi:predicted MFS family arabinose efflux permease
LRTPARPPRSSRRSSRPRQARQEKHRNEHHQILTPFAGDLSDDASRGRVIGIVVSGLLTGILLARIIAGLIGGAAGWRAVFVFAAALMAVLAVLLYRALPVVPPKASLPYRSLLHSVIVIVRWKRPLQVIMVFGTVGFATFTMFWTALTWPRRRHGRSERPGSTRPRA